MLHLDGSYIPFVELGSTTGINQVPLMSALDSKSANVTISTPFSFGSTVSTSLSVSQFCIYNLIILYFDSEYYVTIHRSPVMDYFLLAGVLTFSNQFSFPIRVPIATLLLHSGQTMILAHLVKYPMKFILPALSFCQW
jgi:hypothetical protein